MTPVGNRRRIFHIAAILSVAAGAGIFLVGNPGEVGRDAGRIRIRGLEMLDLDAWTKRLSGESPATADVTADRDKILEIFGRYSRTPEESEGFREFGRAVTDAFGRAYGSDAEYRALAIAIESARDRIRTYRPTVRARKAALALTLFSEEAIYVSLRRFRSGPEIFRVDGPAAKTPCPTGRGPADLYGIPVCPGDTVISKGGEFSSALILFRTPLAAAFSHSALVVPSERNELRLLEADGFGGNFNRISEESPPARLKVYRLRRDRDPGGASLSKMLARAAKIVRGWNPGMEDRVFGFNFNLDPDCRPGRYYCSQLNYCMFSDAGLEDNRNPYARENWSAPTESGESFIDRIWPAYKGPIPNPPDVEMNPDYELVGHRLEVPGVARLRVQFVVLNALMRVLTDEPAIGGRYLANLVSLGSHSLAEATDSEMRRVKRLTSLSDPAFARIRSTLPGDLNLREIVFYYHVQQVLLPEVEDRLLEAETGNPVIEPIGALGARATLEIRARLDAFNRALAVVNATL